MSLPAFANAALLLDLDGTLLDLAPTPDAVVIPLGLTDTLRTLRTALGGALAIITGRPIEAVDRFLGDTVPVVAGEHGGAIRHGAGLPIERPDLPPVPPGWFAAGEALERAHPGSLYEQKQRGFGLHFRLAPDAGPAIHAALTALLAGSAAFELMPGSFLWEVRPRGIDKGDAVERLMARVPFLGRLPVFIGDDVTDRDGIRAADAMGGAGLWVPDVFGDALGARAWLAETAARGDWGKIRCN